MKKLSSKRTKELDIPIGVKKKVWERDNGCCVICGNTYNVMPNSHFIKRSKGGLGIEENVFIACTNLTENKCHMRWDLNRCIKEEIKRVEEYLKKHYQNWNFRNLYYKKN